MRAKSYIILLATAALTFASCSELASQLLVEDPLNSALNHPQKYPSANTKAQEKQQQARIKEGKCPTCNGMGKSPDGKYTCVTCNGTGKYQQQPENEKKQ